MKNVLAIAILCVILAISTRTIAQDFDCEIDGTFLMVNQFYDKQPGTCRRIICTAPNSLRALNCDSVLSGKSCPQHNSKPYPDCCPRLDCETL